MIDAPHLADVIRAAHVFASLRAVRARQTLPCTSHDVAACVRAEPEFAHMTTREIAAKCVALSLPLADAP